MMQCGMGPTGSCDRVILGMGEAYRYRVSDLMRHDDSSFRTLVACHVKQASQLADTSPGFEMRKRPALGH